MAHRPRPTRVYLVACICLVAACALCAGAGLTAARGATARGGSAQGFNGLVAFAANRDGVPSEIYTMNPDGTGLTNLTDADSFDMHPGWQPLAEPFVAPSPTPTASPAPTPTPPDDYGPPETWEPYLPPPEQVTLGVVGCGGRTFVKANFFFHSGGYRVAEQGEPARSGSDISVDAKLERWTGAITLSPFSVDHVYDLGTLAPGSYTFTLRSRGTFVKSVSFDAGPGSASSPADDPTVFVWQHYRDFLGRDPDEWGFHFWQLNLTDRCGNNPACLERKRIDTSAAFFLSIEFQRTGFLVHKLYRASYGRMPRREELLTDARQIARGVIVHERGWEGALEENTRAFFDAWVARQSFAYEFGQLSDAQFVARLFHNAGVEPDAEESDRLVAALADGSMTRAHVLRAVAEDERFSRKEFAPAFVLMQYFGYLRRNPDEGRDTNWDGYNYWLSKLERFGGDHVRAEMVRAFLVSDEYRARFCGQ